METRKMESKEFDQLSLRNIANIMHKALTNSSQFSKLGSYQQAIAIEAVTFNFKRAPFTYDHLIDIQQDEITKVKTVKEFYKFYFTYIIPGTKHELKLEKQINKKDLE
jgi:hypothetical protein